MGVSCLQAKPRVGTCQAVRPCPSPSASCCAIAALLSRALLLVLRGARLLFLLLHAWRPVAARLQPGRFCKQHEAQGAVVAARPLWQVVAVVQAGGECPAGQKVIEAPALVAGPRVEAVAPCARGGAEGGRQGWRWPFGRSGRGKGEGRSICAAPPKCGVCMAGAMQRKPGLGGELRSLVGIAGSADGYRRRSCGR